MGVGRSRSGCTCGSLFRGRQCHERLRGDRVFESYV